jgi:hypothetical protein
LRLAALAQVLITAISRIVGLIAWQLVNYLLGNTIWARNLPPTESESP